MKKSMIMAALLIVCGAGASVAQPATWIDTVFSNAVSPIDSNTVVTCSGVTVLLQNPTSYPSFYYRWYRDGAAHRYDTIEIARDNPCPVTVVSDRVLYCVGFPIGSSSSGRYRVSKYIIRVVANNTVYDTVTTCTSYTWHGETYTETGTYRDTVVGSCDTNFYILNLTIVKGNKKSGNGCIPYLLNWWGHNDIITDTNTHYYYRDTSGTWGHCTVQDEFKLRLFGDPDTLPALNTSACESFTWNVTEGQLTFVRDTVTPLVQVGVNTTTSCPQYQSLNLTIHHNVNTIENITACDSCTWNGTNYMDTPTTPPTYNTTTIHGCDSMVTLHLTINRSSISTETKTACDSYTWHGTTYYTSTNTPTYIEQNHYGCNSIVTLNLTINNSTTETVTLQECDSYTWHGVTYTTSTNTPTFDTVNARGCDSTAILHLTINRRIDTTEFATACGSYEWKGITFSTSNGPTTKDTTYKVPNATLQGCDSIYTLHLVLNPTSSGNTAVTVCDQYSWRDSTYYTTQDLHDTLFNQYGCDSILTIHLTINHGTHTHDTVSECDLYEWHGTVYRINGDYIYPFINSGGCPSTESLHLTIITADNQSYSVTACEQYIWNIDGQTFKYDTTSDYTYRYNTNELCPRVDTLHLTVLGIKVPQVQELVEKNTPHMLIYPIPYADSNENYHFQWYRNGQPISGATRGYYVLTDNDRQSFLYNDSVPYSVRVWNKLEMCGSNSEITVKSTAAEQPEIVTLPNPSDGRFVVTLHADGEEAAEATLYNAYGNKVATLPLDGNTATSNTSLPTGVYMVNIVTRSGKLLTDKIIIK